MNPFADLPVPEWLLILEESDRDEAESTRQDQDDRQRLHSPAQTRAPRLTSEHEGASGHADRVVAKAALTVPDRASPWSGTRAALFPDERDEALEMRITTEDRRRALLYGVPPLEVARSRERDRRMGNVIAATSASVRSNPLLRRAHEGEWKSAS